MVNPSNPASSFNSYNPNLKWPAQNPTALNSFYGNPDPNGDGFPDRSWEDANLTLLEVPYRMVLAWDNTQVVRHIKVNKACSDSLMRVLVGILSNYGSQEAVEKARMHLFGGCYNFRLKRGGTSQSVHSWGAAIDIDPETNKFGRAYNSTLGMMPMDVVKIFQSEGWCWGGNWHTPDAMHFQAARV